MPLIANSISLVSSGVSSIGADALEDVAEEVQFPIGIGRSSVCLAAGEELGLGHGQCDNRADRGTG